MASSSIKLIVLITSSTRMGVVSMLLDHQMMIISSSSQATKMGDLVSCEPLTAAFCASKKLSWLKVYYGSEDEIF